MKKLNLIAFILIWMGASAQKFEWARKGGLWAYDYGNGVATDNAGNVYLAGKYEKNAKFSGVTLPCQGNHDIFTAKYSPSGSLLWIRTAGGYTGDYATCVATDSRFVYMGGEVEGSNATIKFPGSSITVKCKGGNDIVLAKYDLNGNLLWARSAGGYGDDKALGISYDAYGNIYIAGCFESKCYFPGTTLYTRGERDIFVAKYDANGNFKWARAMGSSQRDEAKAIKVDAYGNIYICGMYKNGCKFGDKYLSAPNGAFNAFVARLTSNGDLVWVKTGGGSWDDVAWGITMDKAGKLFIAGEFNATAYFSDRKIWTTGSADVFVACYDAWGNIKWIQKGGGKNVDRARAIGTDGYNIFITGQFGYWAKFGGTTRYAPDKWDIFVAGLNNSGSWLWATSVGGGTDPEETLGYESGNTVCADGYGNVYASGALLKDGSFGSTWLTTYSRTDVWLAKLKHGVAGREADDGNEPPLAAEDELQFDGTAAEKQMQLNWKYAAEQKKDIILEKSADNNNFDALKAYAADEVGPQPFSYTDLAEKPNTVLYYRLRLVDEEGVTSFSRTLSLTSSQSLGEGIEIFPNPAQTNIAVTVKNPGDKKLQLAIFDISGREVYTEELVNGCCKVDISPWSRGTYIIVIKNDEAVISRQKVLVQ